MEIIIPNQTPIKESVSVPKVREKVKVLSSEEAFVP